MEIEKGQFYWTDSGVMFVESFESDFDEGRTYAHGPILRLEEKDVDVDLEGKLISTLRANGSSPLNDKDKKKVVAQFAKVRRKGVAEKFFKKKLKKSER